MPDCQADTNKCHGANATILASALGKAEEASTSISPVFIKSVDSRRPLDSIDLTASDEDASKGPGSKSTAPNGHKPRNSDSPSSALRTYNLRGGGGGANKAENVGNDTESEEDKEDLMSKLSVYKQRPDGSFACELCSAKGVSLVTERKTPMIRHLLRAHTYCHSYECSSCPDTFRKENWLRSHALLAHPDDGAGGEFFECARCKHLSRSQVLLRLHALRRHAAVYRYACNCCAKCFKSWRAKNEHERTLERDRRRAWPEPRYVCDKCSVVARSKSDFVRHLKKAHSEDFYKNIHATNKERLSDMGDGFGPDWGAKILLGCERCGKPFVSRKSLRGHLAVHPASPSDESAAAVAAATVGFECGQCGKRLSSKDHLKKHARVHSGERPYACPECGQAFALRTTMRIHALSHRGIKPYVCRLCGLGYSQRSALMIHWKSKHRELPPPPPIEIHQYFDEDGKILVPCEKKRTRCFRKQTISSKNIGRNPLQLTASKSSEPSSKTSSKLVFKNVRKPTSERKRDQLLEISKEQKKSAIAEKKITSKCLNIDMSPTTKFQKVPLEIKKEPAEPLKYKKLKDGDYGCKICHQKFSHGYKVRQHIKFKHDARDIFKCAECSRTFTSKYHLNMHYNNKHSENSNDYLFSCDKCEYRAKSKHYLKTHEIRKHTTEYNYECDHCKKRFKMKMDLKFHLGTHGVSQHMCDACGRMYKSQDSLYKHRRVQHLNEYKFQCEVCHQKLLTQENFNSHMKSHENLHSCDQCDLKFTKKYYVTRHKKRVHKVEKLNLCPVCGKAFMCMATFRVHYLTHAKIKPYMCNVCGFSFTQRSSMMLHWKRKHPDAADPPPPVILTNFFDAVQSEVNKNATTNTDYNSGESSVTTV